jgi:diaminopimelate decarboxylase
VLEIGGLPVTQIAGEFGTPLFIYDGNMIRERYDAVRAAFPSFEVFYSLKANPSLALIGFIQTLGAGAEIASGGELFLAKEVGFDPLDIVFAGPGKTDRELEQAIVFGIFALNVESFREMERIAHLSKLVGVPARVGIRVNTSDGLSAPGGGSAGPLHEQMAGGPSKFGIDEEKLERLRAGWDRRAIEIAAVHVYTASQILDPDEIVENARRTVSVAQRIEETTGSHLMAIDFGAGLGVPHYEEERPIDLPSLGRRIEEVFEPYVRRGGVRLILELGRYLVSECGVFVSKILELKESRGERFIITDGGINQFLRPVLMKVNHEARVVNRLGAPSALTAKVSGPLCTPIDITSTELEAPEGVSLDDLVGIFNAGAYGYSMSPQLFLSHPAPPEVLVVDGEMIQARARGEHEDLLLNQKPFPGRA